MASGTSPSCTRPREEVFRTYFDDHRASGGAPAIVERASGALIGATRYDNFDPERSEVEIGWTFLARRYWGGVYNADLRRIMLEYAFKSVRMVVFLVAENNLRSRRAVEKLGAVENGRRRAMVLYELSR